MADKNLISLLDHSIEDFRPQTSRTRIQQIVLAYKTGLLTGKEAQALLADPAKSLPEKLQNTALARRGPKLTRNLAGGMIPHDNPDTPYCFSFQNFRSFLAPSRYGTGDQRLVLPVTPEQVEITLGNGAQTITNISGRTFTHAATEDLEKISFETFLPLVDGETRPSYITPQYDPNTMGNRGDIVFKFLQSMRTNQPLIFSVYNVGTLFPGDPVVSPIEVTITNMTRTVKSGHGADIFFSMELQRWNPQSLGQGTYRTSNGAGTSNDGTKPKVRKYTVRVPETIVNIALKQLGSGSRWREILKLNPKLYKLVAPIPSGQHSNIMMFSRVKLEPGTTLTLPVS